LTFQNNTWQNLTSAFDLTVPLSSGRFLHLKNNLFQEVGTIWNESGVPEGVQAAGNAHDGATPPTPFATQSVAAEPTITNLTSPRRPRTMPYGAR
jgi:hypothetical protein